MTDGTSDIASATVLPLKLAGNTTAVDEAVSLTKAVQTSAFSIYSEQFKELSASLAKSVPDISGFASALDEYRKHSENLSELMRQMQPSMSSLLTHYSDLVVSLQPQVFESVRLTTSAFIKRIPLIDFSAVTESVRKGYESFRYIEILEKANWPLYLVDKADFIKDLLSIDDNIENAEAAEYVKEKAKGYLNLNWLQEIHKSWNSLGIAQEYITLLEVALSHHEKEEYLSSVAILMTLFEGFAEQFAKLSISALGLDEESFNWQADKYGLSPYYKKDGTPRQLCPKDYVIVLTLQMERGWYTWQSAASYINNIVLYRGEDFRELAEHNPLRNKICHGIQTNYGSWEHSVKAILATDLVLRMALAIETSIAAKNSADAKHHGIKDINSF